MWQFCDRCHSSVTVAAKPSADGISLYEIQIHKYMPEMLVAHVPSTLSQH